MKRILNKLFSPESACPLLFILMIYIIGATTESFSDVLKSCVSPAVITIAGTIIIIVLFFTVEPVERLIAFVINRGREIVPESESCEKPQRHKGLIVFCSLGVNLSAEQAIRYHYKGLDNEYQDSVLEKCWLISGGTASRDAARNMLANLIKDGFPTGLFEIKEMTGADADNPGKVYEFIDTIYNQLPTGYDVTDVIADYTGGTKSMTAGMILSCAMPDRHLQFMKAREYNPDGTANRNQKSDPISVDIRFKLKQVKQK